MVKIKPLPRYLLEFTIFISGAVVMILELTGSRILSPYLGASTFIWTSLIGIVLGSLSIGYYLGGKLADKNATPKTLSNILFLASITTLITAAINPLILHAIEENFTDIRVAAIFASILLFTPASIFLGMVSPYAVRLKIHTVETSGRTVGNLYAISTVGSIFGTFFAGFFLLSYIGSVQILLVLGITLSVIAIPLTPQSSFKSSKMAKLLLLIIILAVAFKTAAQKVESKTIDVDTEYSRVLIYDEENIRYMEIANDESSGMYLNSDELVFEYTKFYDIAEHFNPELKNGLLIGGGAFSYPKHFLQKFPEANLDVVEIDEKLTELSEKYFKLDTKNPRLKIYNEDGRTYLNKTTKKYDVIFGDAFKSFYSIPTQLTTKEAVQKNYDALNENGVVVLNVISSIEGDTGKFTRAEYRTYAEVFPQVYLFPTKDPDNPTLIQNITLVALKSPTKATFSSNNPELQNYLDHLYTKEIPLDMPVLTDNFAPVDSYIAEFFDYVKL